MHWSELEGAAPEIVRRGRERLEGAGVALLGTVRADGTPRISPVEPFVSDGRLVFGCMARSRKARDLERDPRCVLHSAVTGPGGAEGELKLTGVATRARAAVRDGCRGAWWVGRPAELAAVFELDIRSAAFIGWDTERGRMTVHRWSPGAGPAVETRAYP